MDPARAQQLRRSFDSLAPTAMEVARAIVQRLDRLTPEARALLPDRLTTRAGSLASLLIAVVEDAGRGALPALRLAQEPGPCGAPPAAAHLLRREILAAVRALAGPTWDAQLAEDWRTVAALVGDALLASPVVVRRAA